jgi:diguanylate cyclase (GGDEF)-like protein/PAS domain S-box-containing protein
VHYKERWNKRVGIFGGGARVSDLSAEEVALRQSAIEAAALLPTPGPVTDGAISWQAVLEALPDGAFLLDFAGIIRFVNNRLLEFTGYTCEEVVGAGIWEFVPPQLEKKSVEAQKIHQEGDLTRPLIWDDSGMAVLCKDGSEFPVDFALTSLRVFGEEWGLACVRDNRDRRAAQHARELAERDFRLAFEATTSPTVLVGLDGRATAANEAFCSLLGLSREEVLAMGVGEYTHPDDISLSNGAVDTILSGKSSRTNYTKRYVHKDGHIITVEVFMSGAYDEHGELLYLIISERDISKEIEMSEALQYRAYHDPLTGLANRALLDERMNQARARMARTGSTCAIVLIDLDGFKLINDEWGHLLGDKLLTEVAIRLTTLSRETDTLCRFGGDEFLYLAENIGTIEEAQQLASRLNEAFSTPYIIEGREVVQRASFGVSLWNKDMRDALFDADAALYAAKRSTTRVS